MPSDSHSLIMSPKITPWVEIRSLAGSDSDSNDSDTRSKNAPTLCLRFPESSFSYIPSGQFIRGKLGGKYLHFSGSAGSWLVAHRALLLLIDSVGGLKLMSFVSIEWMGRAMGSGNVIPLGRSHLAALVLGFGPR